LCFIVVLLLASQLPTKVVRKPSMEQDQYDCIVIGAGPAGLSASLFLARYLRRTLTFHHNSPRNEYAHGVHGFLGHHGIPPAELLARGRDEVTQHGGLIIEACVTRVNRVAPDRFVVSTDDGSAAGRSFATRRILLATGLRDLTPDCPGFREFYGVSVHHCPDCDGYECKDQHIAVLGKGRSVAGFAENLLTWTNKLTVITQDKLDSESHAKLSELDIRIRNDSVTGLEGDLDTKQLKRVLFAESEPLECDKLFFNFGFEPASNLHEMLGCKLDQESGLLWTDQTQQTSVEGVYAAGDITPKSQLAVVAAAEGAMAAIHIHQSLNRMKRD
jgi:thioredoxin reductase